MELVFEMEVEMVLEMEVEMVLEIVLEKQERQTGPRKTLHPPPPLHWCAEYERSHPHHATRIFSALLYI